MTEPWTPEIRVRLTELETENAELKAMLKEVLAAHPHIEPKPGCLICQALDKHESLRWGE